MRTVFGRKEAIIASLIWIFSYFSILASLMVDTDGQIMPFFFLLALIGYYKLQGEPKDSKRLLWGVLLVVACIGGFLVKVSFLLAIGAIIADFLWSKRNLVKKKDLLKYGLYAVNGVVSLAVILFLMKFIFPFFDLQKSLTYWEHFAVLDRGWFQTFIQCAKAVLYASPFLILTPFFGKKENFSRVKVFIFFLIFAFIFYVVLFDFSIGALDRYLQLIILPLTVLSTVVLSSIFKEDNRSIKKFLILGSALGLIFVLLQFLPHYVPPLYPKSEWVSLIFSLKWNFLYPFSGGSGPLGFYVSFLFMALAWIVSFVVLALARTKPQFKKIAVAFLIPLGLIYNGVFAEEYLFGGINGSAPKLVRDSVAYIAGNSDIKSVVVYNDNGGNEVQKTGKYARRLYATPQSEKFYEDFFRTFSGYVLYIDIPKVSESTFYGQYMSMCKDIYNEKDNYISAVIYDCREVKL
jgi:4-amino-4-deoxy-L-arabinose transferase-like glycosyltransferase